MAIDLEAYFAEILNEFEKNESENDILNSQFHRPNIAEEAEAEVRSIRKEIHLDHQNTYQNQFNDNIQNNENIDENENKETNLDQTLTQMSTQDFDKLYNYILISENPIIEDLIINLGTDNIGRFSCANHKINLIVRSSIIKHLVVSEDLVKTKQLCFSY